MANEEHQPLVVDPTEPIPPGHWHDDMSEVCTDDATCCASSFCPCCRWATTMSRAHIMPFGKAIFLYSLIYIVPFTVLITISILTPEAIKAERFSTAYIPIVVLGIVAWGSILAGFALCTWGRQQIRLRYNIPGDRNSDCWAHSSSHCSALAQEARHVEAGLPR